MNSSSIIWQESDWKNLEIEIKAKALNVSSDKEALNIIIKEARRVMRKYTNSFYMVSRFLPKRKRDFVEAVYAAVRYPDEIVDTFNLSPDEKKFRLDNWEQKYLEALKIKSIQESLKNEIPPFIASFAKVVQNCKIPKEYYISFLNAMGKDAFNVKYKTLDELINSYIYGSAIVVGYFLTYIYGASNKQQFERALHASRELGIALQLTNFMRDVQEDILNGRLYIPVEMLEKNNININDILNPEYEISLKKIINNITLIADKYYHKSLAELGAFSPDCRTAIKACIDVYSKLNKKILANHNSVKERQTIPFIEKFQVLPVSKYWVIPINYFSR